LCSPGGPEIIELNLSGCSIVSLPDDITQVFSALKTLHLRNCTKLQYLPWSLGSITSLQSVSITEGCPELLYPPKSQQTDAMRTAKFLSQVHKQSEFWRRVKVLFEGCLLDTVFTSHVDYVYGQRLGRKDIRFTHIGKTALAAFPGFHSKRYN
jgi:hypothetical protein